MPSESEASLVRYTSDIVTILGTDGTLCYGNPAVERVLGYRPEERMGTNAFEYVHPDDVERVSKALVEGLGSPGVHPPVELRFRHSDGSWRHLEVIANNLLEDPNVKGIVLTSRDITERKQTERRLEESEQRHRSLFEHNPDAAYSFDLEGNFLAANTACERISGYTVEELLRASFMSLVVEEDLERTLRHFEKAVQGEPQNYENAITHKDGHRVELNVTKLPIVVGEEVVGVYGIAKDVTGRKKAEEALRKSAEWFRGLIQNSSDIITVVGDDGIIRYQSPSMRHILGHDPEERIGKNIFASSLVHPDDRAERKAVFERVMQRPGAGVRHEMRMRHRDGSWRYIEATTTNLLDDPSVGSVVINSRDVTGRKRAEEALRESEERFRQLFDQTVDALLVHDQEGRMIDCNAEACRSLGYSREELLALSVRDFATNLLSDEEKKTCVESGTLWQRAASRQPGTGMEGIHLGYHRRKDGSAFPVEVRVGSVDYGGKRMIFAAARDVTERKRAEEALRESEERYRTLVEQAADAVFVHDREGRLVDANRRACESLGYAREELLSLSVEDIEQNTEPGGFAGLWERVVSGGPVTFEGVHRRKDATTFPVEVRVGLFEAGRRRLMLAVARDVTERKRAEEALKEGRGRLAEAQRIARVGSWEYAVGDDEAHWSDEIYRIFGHDPESFVPAYRAFLRSVHPDDRRAVLKMFRKVLREGKHYGHSAEFRVVRPDGRVRAVHARYEVIREDEAGRPVGVAGTLQDVTERKALEERLEHQAFHDPLTGLPNRALFSDRLAHALARVERRGRKVAVLFMDLDNFKYVNDSLGHDAGDRLLAAAAGRLRRCVRPGDTAARLGGDEFAVLLEGSGDAGGEAIRVAERIVEALREPFDLGGRELYAGTSVGIQLGEAGRDRPEDLLRKADLALYEAKRGGKARYALFDPEAERRSMLRLDLENGLRRGIERDEFRVCYQPMVSLKTGRIAGFEALVRWEHPERGLVHPEEFVPLAEENGLIVPIGERVLREACRQAKGWQEHRPAGPPPIVGVNLSARQLSHPDLLGEVEGALDEAGLDPGRLTLEVTEGVLVEDAERHVDALRRLKALGVRLAIDDFGTGYSSLSYLKRLPADLVKLDGSFVAGIGEGAEEDEVLLPGVIGIAHGLGLEVVAEGVETAEQAARLRGLGCDLAQGNHFSGPLPGEAASRLLA